ncbi:MAG: hypothetical protein WC886_08305, partial [Saccharofermentanaceae bacterium]
IGGAEDDQGWVVQDFQQLKSGEFGHLYIQKNQIRLEFLNSFQPAEPIRKFTGDLNFRETFQVMSEYITGGLFVINKNSA